MQQIDVSINPRVLTDKELLRLADYYLATGNLPRDWQLELIERLAQYVK